MRRTVLVSVLTLLLSVVFVPISIAEMAKEGSGTATAYYTATSVVHAQGKAYVQINYDARGVSVSESETDPFHQTSQQCVGAIKAVKGVIKEFGLCTFTRPDGDKIYVSYEATGQFGKGVKGNMTFVGGTGKCETMTGTGEFERKPLKGPVKGASASVSKSTYSWKIAAAK